MKPTRKKSAKASSSAAKPRLHKRPAPKKAFSARKRAAIERDKAERQRLDAAEAPAMPAVPPPDEAEAPDLPGAAPSVGFLDAPARTIAIVGRPNVGKSSLFNAIARRRIAIVHSEEGVTRDILSAPAEYEGQRFQIVDTGGLAQMDRARSDDAIAAAAAEQVHAAIVDAAAIILVVDIRAGLKPLDLEVARLLRTAHRPVFVAANKADDDPENHAGEDFFELGYPVFPVSATHHLGLDALLSAALKTLPPATAADEPMRLSIAVVGRPNAGKSSYINRLLGRNRLIVSDVAGTTRDTIRVPFSIENRHYWLIDTAGMRKQGRVHASVEKFSLFRAEQAIADADLVVLVLDAQEGPGTQEKKIAALVRENHKACVVLVNKWDIAREHGDIRPSDYEKAMRKDMFFLGDIPVLFISAKTGENVKRSFAVIDAVATRLETRLPTGVLNRAIRDAFAASQPPVRRNRQLKFYYATQTGRNPPRVTLFVNDPTLSTPAHQAFLASKLRTAFALGGVPIVIRYRSSHGEKSDE